MNSTQLLYNMALASLVKVAEESPTAVSGDAIKAFLRKHLSAAVSKGTSKPAAPRVTGRPSLEEAYRIGTGIKQAAGPSAIWAEFRAKLKKHEKTETPAQERQESPKFQALERLLGTEAHGPQ